jgi:Na+/glutamate symporter
LDRAAALQAEQEEAARILDLKVSKLQSYVRKNKAIQETQEYKNAKEALTSKLQQATRNRLARTELACLKLEVICFCVVLFNSYTSFLLEQNKCTRKQPILYFLLFLFVCSLFNDK